MGKPFRRWPKPPINVAASRHVDGQWGFSLLDALVATMLLGVVAVVVFSAFAIGLRAASLAGGLNTAVSLAEETLAALSASPCGASFHLSITPEPEDPRFAGYRREVSASRLPDGGLWSLSVTVRWTQQRQTRSVTLTTLRHVSSACTFVGQP